MANKYILVKKSQIHSNGVIAKKDIPNKTRIIEYVGKKVTKAVSNKLADIPLEKAKKNKNHGAVYIFELNKRHDIDGYVSYNLARYINHSCKPNCEVDIIRGHIWIIALREIKKGEELTYNYGYDYEDYDEHKCFCGQSNCVGFILAEDHWVKLKRKQRQKKRLSASNGNRQKHD
jgi:uncharacterized protein